jgi:hypothetical protein
MFGFMKKSSDAQQEREAQVEKAKMELRKFVHGMADLRPDDMERKVQQLKDWCNSDKLVPFDFKQKALKRAAEMERAANMLYCDMRLHDATDATLQDNNKLKGEKLAEARAYFGRACTLGADPDWRKAYKRAEENLLMTGNMKHDAPSRAKPLDTAPKAPNRAKA